MAQFNSYEEEDEYWEHRISKHPFCRMRNAMEEIWTVGFNGDKLRELEKQKAEIFWKYWNEGARDWLKEQGRHGTLALDEIGDELIYSIDITDVLFEVNILLYNSGMHEERISLCESLLGFFNWKEDAAGEARFRAHIGESLEELGRKEECDSYFLKLLEDEPDNVEYINMYLNCLCDRKAYEEARILLEKHMKSGMEVTDGNELLFWRAEEIYKGLGNVSQASFFRSKREKWEDSRSSTVSPLNTAAAEMLEKDPDALKELGLDLKMDIDATATNLPKWKMWNGEIIGRGSKKVYPNDPCPCGSGKKFKKCCGKKA